MGKEKVTNKLPGRFLALPHALIFSARFTALTPSALKLLIDIAVQFNGKNNGDLSAAWKIMRKRGWNSEATLNRAKKVLLALGLIAETRKGRLPNVCALYGLTWLPLDASGKYDITPKGFPAGEWAKPMSTAVAPAARTEATEGTTASVTV